MPSTRDQRLWSRILPSRRDASSLYSPCSGFEGSQCLCEAKLRRHKPCKPVSCSSSHLPTSASLSLRLLFHPPLRSRRLVFLFFVFSFSILRNRVPLNPAPSPLPSALFGCWLPLRVPVSLLTPTHWLAVFPSQGTVESIITIVITTILLRFPSEIVFPSAVGEVFTRDSCCTLLIEQRA